MSKAVITSEALEALMIKVFNENAVAPGLFWDAIIKANLYLPLAKDETDQIPFGEKTATGEERFPVLLARDSSGKKVLWLFTSKNSLFSYTEQTLKYIEIPAVTVFNNVKTFKIEIVLIGPGNLSLSLNPKLLTALADGVVPEEAEKNVNYVPKDAKVFVGRPQDDTTALEEKFVPIFNKDKNVFEAAFIQVAEGENSRLLLGLKLEDESRENLKKIVEKLAKAAEGVLDKGKTMDVTLINGSLKEAFKKYAIPFFKRVK